MAAKWQKLQGERIGKTPKDLEDAKRRYETMLRKAERSNFRVKEVEVDTNNFEERAIQKMMKECGIKKVCQPPPGRMVLLVFNSRAAIRSK